MIKLKQDEDKAAARLHSFKFVSWFMCGMVLIPLVISIMYTYYCLQCWCSFSCKINECSVPSSDKTERMKSLRSTNSAKVCSKHVHYEILCCCSFNIYWKTNLRYPSCGYLEIYFYLSGEKKKEFKVFYADNLFCIEDE